MMFSRDITRQRPLKKNELKKYKRKREEYNSFHHRFRHFLLQNLCVNNNNNNNNNNECV